ncbi:MAG: hypothetical protein WD096_01210 [Actinomycetota bacterium]
MVRFQRQPPGTAITRSVLVVGAWATAVAAWLVVSSRPREGGLVAAFAALLLLVGGHRANHGAGGPVDRMLTELLDRAWDGGVLGAIVWENGAAGSPSVAAIVALSASYLSSYVRARGAALGYSVEESHVTRGLRYALISIALVSGGPWLIMVAATLSVLTALVRITQVAREERTA